MTKNFNIYALDPTLPADLRQACRHHALINLKGARTFIHAVPRVKPDIIYNPLA